MFRLILLVSLSLIFSACSPSRASGPSIVGLKQQNGTTLFYNQRVVLPEDKTVTKNDKTFALYLLSHRQSKEHNEKLVKYIVKKIPYSHHKNYLGARSLFRHIQEHRDELNIPKDSIAYLPKDISVDNLLESNGSVSYFSSGIYINNKKEKRFFNFDELGKEGDLKTYAIVTKYGQDLIEFKPKMTVTPSAQSTQVTIHPKNAYIIKSKTKIFYKIKFDYPVKIKELQFYIPKFMINQYEEDLTPITYKLCFNHKKCHFYGFDDNLNPVGSLNDQYDRYARPKYVKDQFSKQNLFKLDQTIKELYFSIDNYLLDLDNISVTEHRDSVRNNNKSTITYANDFIFDYDGSSDECIVTENLRTRKDKKLNEDLIRNIALKDEKLFRYIQKNHKKINVSSVSLAHLPEDVSIRYALKHSATIYKSGRYKNKYGKYKKMHSSRYKFSKKGIKYSSKHKVSVKGTSKVKIKKSSHKRKKSHYIDFSQGI